ncbi:protein SPA1-RELATED 4-like isoform X1 [Musa acuminata AAA Group]|uniref:protein SPA1-RELATED 4-like isoform X1 n=1 Tax=Musa acuminata AAA Group TaxID=214697 RepID=UPI0031CF2F29
MGGSEDASGRNTACVASSGSLRAASRGEGDDGAEEDEEGEEPRRRPISPSAAAGFEAGFGNEGEVSLREWLDQPGRAVDLLQCLHIFRQIADAVSAAHAQGVVVGNVRPSCFVMSSLDRVSFIESASCSSSSDSSEDGAGSPDGFGERGATGTPESASEMLAVSACLEETKERGEGDVGAGDQTAFPLKKILLMESIWYTSPEEATGRSGTFASDIYRLGVLLFELFCTFDSLEEKLITMSNLRHRVLPPQLLLKWPKEASFCLWLLHPQPDTRPKMSEVLHSEFLNQPRDSLEERDTAIKLKEEIEDQELLLDFLLHLQQRKKEIADRLHDTVCFLSADIEEVLHQQSILKNKSYQELDNDEHSAVGTLDKASLHPVMDEHSYGSGSRKRLRPELQNFVPEENVAEGARSETDQQIQENALSKSSRLMKNFKKLEAAYFSARCRQMKPSGKSVTKFFQVTSSGRGSMIRTEGSSVDDKVYRRGNTGETKSEWINPFLDGLRKYLAFSKLKVRADLKHGDLLNSMNLVCSMGFDRDKEFFATAGVNKKIKVFECDTILNGDRDIHYPVTEMTNTSKISCICWNNYIKSHIASSDFEGVVQVWDATRSQVFAEMREHERRVWSVDFSLADPTKLASGSDDGAVKIWNINQAGSVCTVKTKANVCSVHFQPDSAYSLAIGSADHKIYCYDLRNLRIPSCTLADHMKTVSYVKYLDSSTIISASTDSSLKLWDLSTSISRMIETPLQTFTGHINIKNFVGLSISDGYIATGSETNEVFVYSKAFPMPVLSYKFSIIDPISGKEVDDTSQFISSVCWRGQTSMLLAASSSGNIKFLEMV